MKTVKDVMSAPVITIPLSEAVSTVIDLFKVKSISGAPVVNEAGFAVGLISRSNLVIDSDFSGLTAKDVMTTFVFEITPEKSLLEVAKQMTAAKIRRVIVVEDGKPVGVVTALDVVKHYIELCES